MTEPTTRRRILQAIEDYPGLHLRELARQLGTSLALIEYHVPFLVDAGLVHKEQDANTHRLYPTTVPAADRRRLAALRDRAGVQVVALLLDRGPMRHADLSRVTRMGKSTLSFRLRRLEDAGLVRAEEGKYLVVDPDHVRALLERHRPTPDLLDRFADVWGDLYG